MMSLGLSALTGCAASERPLGTVPEVDIDRFMGRWYVIGRIPTFVEKDAYNAVESYALNPNGTIATTFTFRKGGFDGPKKSYTPTGFVYDDSNAVWGMRFLWPFKADYRIIYLNEDYTQTVIGRNKRDFVWIMARTPAIADVDYRALVEFTQSAGYDISKLERAPQRWP